MKYLLALAFATSFLIIFLGVIIALHLDLFTGLLIFGIGIAYFIKDRKEKKSQELSDRLHRYR